MGSDGGGGGNGGPNIKNGLEVRLVRAPELVSPTEPTQEDGSLFLSNIDSTMLYTVETVHFFQPSNYGTTKTEDDRLLLDVGRRMKEGLGRLLSGPYHFMAGRVRLHGGRLEVHCNRRGVLFAEAVSHTHSLEDLGDLSFPNPEFKKLVIQAFNVSCLDDLPLLLVQVTRLKCGALVIGLGSNHVVMDGLAAVEFMRNYASVVKGGGLVVEPRTDRTALRARDPPEPKYPHDELIKLSDLPPEAASAFTFSARAGAGDEGADISGNMAASQTHVFRSFVLTGEHVRALKREAGRACSSFDAVAAHVWRARVAAMGMGEGQETRMFFAVDVRARLRPPLPAGFCGNAVYPASARVDAGLLAGEPLGTIVGRVQEAGAAVTDEYVRSALDWGELHRGVPAVVHEGCFVAAAWWKLAFHTVDFGFGTPVFCGPVVNGRVEFVLLLPHPSAPDSCQVFLALRPPHMAAFERLVFPSSIQ